MTSHEASTMDRRQNDYPHIWPHSVQNQQNLQIEIRAVKGKGFGLFATQNIRSGSLVLLEAPLFVLPSEDPRYRADFFPAKRHALSDAVQALPKGARRAYFNLTAGIWDQEERAHLDDVLDQNELNTYGRDEDCQCWAKVKTEEILYEIWLLNRFSIKVGGADYSALYANAAYFNHDCDPSVRFDTLDDGLLVCVSQRNISKDEELTISYVSNLSQSGRKRRERLQEWGFTCQCRRCNADAQ